MKILKKLAVLTTLLVAGALPVATPASAFGPSVLFAPSGDCNLFNRNSGRTLSIWSTATTDGANAVQWVENNGGDQQR